MGDLPPVPNLDPDAPPGEAGPAPAPGAAATASAPAAASSAPAPVPAHGTPSEATGATVGEAGVQDSVEEVLQQTSEQTLRLSHLEDILQALNQTLTDLRDEMHAGFAELRVVTEGEGAGSRPTEATFGSSMTDRLDIVEELVTQGARRQSIIIGVAVVQVVLLVVALLFIATSGPPAPSQELPAGAPSYLSPDSGPAETKVEPPPPAETRPKSKRRRRRR